MRRIHILLITAGAALVLATVHLVSAERDAPLAVTDPGSGRIGIYLTANALSIPEVVSGFLRAREEGKIDALVINVKDMHGEVSYASSVPLARSIGAPTGQIDFTLLLPELRKRGFYLIARQVVFYDPLLAAHLGLPDEWLPADNAIARDYNLAIAEEVVGFGFDEIQFDYIRFADGGDLVPAYEARYAAVRSFLEELDRRLAGRVRISADLFGRVLWPWNERRIDPIGQSLEDITPLVDFLTPMLYPSHYAEEAYRNDPYRTVVDALTSGRSRVSGRFRPFLQAFDLRLPEGMTLETYIEEQIRAAKEYGADGYLFWNPASDYTALYRVL
jgi:hypothetical protein